MVISEDKVIEGGLYNKEKIDSDGAWKLVDPKEYAQRLGFSYVASVFVRTKQ